MSMGNGDIFLCLVSAASSYKNDVIIPTDQALTNSILEADNFWFERNFVSAMSTPGSLNIRAAGVHR